MSSKPVPSVFRTVKFKIALWYAALFTLASAITFSFVYWALLASMTAREDRLLLTFANALEFHYMRGSSYGGDGEWLPVEKVPASALKAAKNAKKGLEVFQAEVVKNSSGEVYELAGIADNAAYDIKVSKDGRLIELEETPGTERLDCVEREMRGYAMSQGITRMYFLVRAPTGEVLASSDLTVWQEVARTAPGRTRFNGKLAYGMDDFENHSEKTRVLSKRLFDGKVLEIGKSTESQTKVLDFYLLVFSVVFASMLLFGSVAGWFIARKAMAGVDRVSRAAVSTGQGNFDHRVPLGSEGEEIDNLVLAFNEMIEKIQALVLELKMVSNNIAHDLCTPLTRMRTMAEVSIGGKENLADYKEVAYGIIEECDQMMRLIKTMLEITRIEVGMTIAKTERVDLVDLVSMAHEIFQPLAEDKRLVFSLKSEAAEGLFVKGSRVDLQRVVSNLLDNAIKYTKEGGSIKVSLSRAGAAAKLVVEDDGCGISEADLPHVFDRFYRCDSSRTTPGYGLGLCLAKAIVRAHGGSISVESRLGEGSVFSVQLPLFK